MKLLDLGGKDEKDFNKKSLLSGWVEGLKVFFKDCLQQSKIKLPPQLELLHCQQEHFRRPLDLEQIK